MLPVRRALAFGAHPDDVELQAGGTIAGWTRRGVHVEIACFTSGQKGSPDPAADQSEVAQVRSREAAAAAAALGVAKLHLLGGVDGELEASMASRLEVARLVRLVRPDVVIGHDPWRRWLLHPDHRAAGVLTVDGVVTAREVLAPERLAVHELPAHRPHSLLLFGTDEPDEVVDVTATMEQKLAALREHASQVGEPADMARRIRTWNAAIGAEFGLAFAEAFHLLDTRGR